MARYGFLKKRPHWMDPRYRFTDWLWYFQMRAHRWLCGYGWMVTHPHHVVRYYFARYMMKRDRRKQRKR